MNWDEMAVDRPLGQSSSDIDELFDNEEYNNGDDDENYGVDEGNEEDD